jgi:hypothetical protein
VPSVASAIGMLPVTGPLPLGLLLPYLVPESVAELGLGAGDVKRPK